LNAKTGNSSGSDSEGEKMKVEPVADEKKQESSSESENSDADSDSDEEMKDAAKSNDVNSKKEKEETSSSSDSGSSKSDSDSEDEKPTGKDKATTKSNSSSASSSSSSKSSSSSSSNSSDSDSGDTAESEVPVSKKRKVEEKQASEKSTKKVAVEDTSVNKTMYIRGLPWKASEDEVKDFFASCGEIEHIELPLQDDGRSSGTAVITFADIDACEACLKMNGQDFNGRWINVKYSTPKPIVAPREPSEKPEGCTTVFVGNLSFNIDEETLRASFAECGEISEIRFSEDKETGDFKGYGHIEFVNPESTDKAIEMAGTEIMGRAVRVDYAADKRKQFGGGGRGFGGRDGGRYETKTLFIEYPTL